MARRALERKLFRQRSVPGRPLSENMLESLGATAIKIEAL